MDFNNGFCFKQLVYLLRGKSKGSIGNVLDRIKKMYEAHHIFPGNMMSYIKDELADKAVGILFEISKQIGIYDFIVTGYRPDHQARFTTFAKAMSGVSKDVFRRASKLAAPILQKEYTMPAVWSVKDYNLWHRLGDIMDLYGFALSAYHLQKDNIEFRILCDNAYRKYTNSSSKDLVEEWAYEQIESLSEWQMVPDPPFGFLLETFLQPYIELQLS